jgi:hypothetical protein
MHENREISSTPRSQDRGRSAKAINRKADMHLLEKSDGAVLPVNQSNKEERSSAETGEGRAQTEENIIQSRMRPTQSGERRPQGLEGVREKLLIMSQKDFLDTKCGQMLATDRKERDGSPNPREMEPSIRMAAEAGSAP